jgi:acetylglutamate kinase
MHIIPATTPDHIEQFRALLNEYGQSMAEPSNSSIWSDIATLPGRYAPPQGRMVLGFVDGVLVGCGALSQVNACDGEMKRIYVTPSQRGKGYGRALAWAIVNEARQAGYRRVVLSSWAGNEAPIKLYRAMGFTDIAPFKNPDYANRLVFLGMNVNQSSITNHQLPITVLKVSGSDLDDVAFSRRLAAIIAAQAKAGERPILVHGGGKEITELLGALKLESKFVDGLRVTDAPTRDVALMVLSGLANKRMVAHVLAAGANAIGLSGVDGGLIGVERLSSDLQFVGKPVRVNTQLLSQLCNQQIVPIISPMSLDAAFEICNVNADHAAGAIAAALNATMLTFVTNVPGVLNKDKSLNSNLSSVEVEQLIEDSTISGGMIPKVRTCLEALTAGLSRVRITNLDGLESEGGTVFSN